MLSVIVPAAGREPGGMCDDSSQLRAAISHYTQAGKIRNPMTEWEIAVQAAREKQGEDITVLKIGPENSFTDYFLICTGNNPRQVQAISDSIEATLKAQGVRPIGIEGYSAAEWVLMDYGDFVVHIFSPQSRQFYALERLWKTASRVRLPDSQDSGANGREKPVRTAPTPH